MEEIVSESRHKEINKTATAGDGASFQANLANKLKFQQIYNCAVETIDAIDIGCDLCKRINYRKTSNI